MIYTRDICLRPAVSRLREVSHASIAKLLLFKHLLQARAHVPFDQANAYGPYEAQTDRQGREFRMP